MAIKIQYNKSPPPPHHHHHHQGLQSNHCISRVVVVRRNDCWLSVQSEGLRSLLRKPQHELVYCIPSIGVRQGGARQSN